MGGKLHFYKTEDFFPRITTIELFSSNKSYSSEGNAVFDYSKEWMKVAVEIEDLERMDFLTKYDMSNVNIGKNAEGSFARHYYVTVENVPKDLNGLSLILVPMSKYNNETFIERPKCIFTKIVNYKKSVWKLYFSSKKKLDMIERYFIRFEYNRIRIIACQYALDLMEKYELEQFFKYFNHSPENTSIHKKKLISSFKWENPKIENDQQQRDSVYYIVNELAFPFPFIICGGTGTGKTTCLVESVMQILKLKPKSHILITAPSNSACDEIGMRLLEYLSSEDVYRYYSPKNQDSNLMKENSSISTLKFHNPRYEFFYKQKIVISTLLDTNIFVLAKIKNDHFNYIFIDECQASTEPESLIPIIGLGMDKKKVNANIILVGDHRLLRPIVESKQAKDFGLHFSLLRRALLGIGNKCKYAVLHYNYRTHPAIVHLTNEDLQSAYNRKAFKASEKIQQSVFEAILPNRKIPIIFHSIDSECIEINDSIMNIEECQQVLYYVDYLVERKKVCKSDIGIISPYRAQVKKLKSLLEGNKELEIGTTRFYLGREKQIIILTTALAMSDVDCSEGDYLKFLETRKRFNFLTSRARSLLIVIGNKASLDKIPPWDEFIEKFSMNDLCKHGLVQLDTTVTKKYQTLIEQLERQKKQHPDDNVDEYYYEDLGARNSFSANPMQIDPFVFNFDDINIDCRKFPEKESKRASIFSIKNAALLSFAIYCIRHNNYKLLSLKSFYILCSGVFISRQQHKPIISFSNLIWFLAGVYTFQEYVTDFY